MGGGCRRWWLDRRVRNRACCASAGGGCGARLDGVRHAASLGDFPLVMGDVGDRHNTASGQLTGQALPALRPVRVSAHIGKMGSVSEFLVVYLDSIDERLLDYLDEEDELCPEVVKRLRY